MGGSRSDDWNLLLCNQVCHAAWYWRSATEDQRQAQYTAQFAFLAGVNPQDVVEGMMAAQLFASHAASMECYRRAMHSDQPTEARLMNLTQAAKLTRANAAQVEALAKHRNKGQQKITIEHVHVYQGGQAIVGSNVTPGGGWQNWRGSTPCYYTCSKRPGAVRKPGRARLVSQRQCRTDVAGCTGDRLRERLKATSTPISMADTLRARSWSGADSRR